MPTCMNTGPRDSRTTEPHFNEEAYADALQMVEGWDFTLTIRKLQAPDYGGWTLARAEAAARDYKRYLAVTKALDGYHLVPNDDIDSFWHEHIMDTRRYGEDCNRLFGGMLHHYPFFGMRGPSDEKSWRDACELSNRLWTKLYGEPLYSTGARSITHHSSQRGSSTAQERAVTTINITINITDGKAEVSLARPVVPATAPGEVAELRGKRPVICMNDALRDSSPASEGADRTPDLRSHDLEK